MSACPYTCFLCEAEMLLMHSEASILKYNNTNFMKDQLFNNLQI